MWCVRLRWENEPARVSRDEVRGCAQNPPKKTEMGGHYLTKKGKQPCVILLIFLAERTDLHAGFTRPQR